MPLTKPHTSMISVQSPVEGTAEQAQQLIEAANGIAGAYFDQQSGALNITLSGGKDLKIDGFLTSSSIGNGPLGPTGPQGTHGSDGRDGRDGNKGETGCQGEKGDTGPQGVQGEIGNCGPTGPQGPKGDIGPCGPTGPQGPPGPEGPRGQQGVPGPNGPQGPQGPAGSEGNVGPTGPQGPTGATGATGSNGADGGDGNTYEIWAAYRTINIATGGTTDVSFDFSSTVTSYNSKFGLSLTGSTFLVIPIPTYTITRVANPTPISGVSAGKLGDYAYCDYYCQAAQYDGTSRVKFTMKIGAIGSDLSGSAKSYSLSGLAGEVTIYFIGGPIGILWQWVGSI